MIDVALDSLVAGIIGRTPLPTKSGGSPRGNDLLERSWNRDGRYGS